MSLQKFVANNHGKMVTLHQSMVARLQEILTHERGHFAFYLQASMTVRGMSRLYLKPLFEKEMHSELEHVRQFGDKLVAMDEMPCTDVKTIKLDGQWLSSSEIVRAAVDMERDVLKLYHDVYPLAEEYGAMFGDMSIALLLEENIEHTTADVEEMEKLITTDRLGQNLRSTLYSDR